MGRPRADIDKDQFRKLCEMQCTKQEICEWFKITDKTLDAFCRREYKASFSEVYAKNRANGKISLRRAQFQLATQRLNPTMLIWLGRQYLGQTDRPEDSIEQEDSDEYFAAAGLQK